MCKIIFIGNYKGGVGKTTTTINLAQHFSKLGNKILTVDLDPQSSLSEIQVNNFHSKKTLKDLPDENTLNYVYELSILKLKSTQDYDWSFLIQSFKSIPIFIIIFHPHCFIILVRGWTP